MSNNIFVRQHHTNHDMFLELHNAGWRFQLKVLWSVNQWPYLTLCLLDLHEFVHGDMVWIGKIVLGKQRLSSNVPPFTPFVWLSCFY